MIRDPDLTSDPRSGRIGARWEWGHPRRDKAGPEGEPSGEAGHDGERVLLSTLEFWHKVMAIDLWGEIYSARAVLDHMIERHGGAIVTVA